MNIPPIHFALIEAFLGSDAVPVGERGPETLLGLGVGDTSPQHVYAAMQARLAQISAHPRGTGPEADILRLIVQAAATQLLAPPPPTLSPPVPPMARPESAPRPMDLAPETPPAPTPRSFTPPTPPPAERPPPPAPIAVEPLETPAPRTTPAPPVAAAPQPRAPIAPPPRAAAPGAFPGLAIPPTDPLVREAARLVAAEGAITPAVVQRLAGLAMARGLPATAVQSILASLSGQVGGPEAPTAQRPAAPPSPSPTSPAVTPRPITGPAVPPPRSVALASSLSTQGPGTPSPTSTSNRPQAEAWLRQPEPDSSLNDPEEEDPGQRLLRVALIVGGSVFAAALITIVVGLSLISGQSPAPTPTPTDPIAAAPTPAPAPKPAPVDPEYDLGSIPDAAAVVRLVRKSTDTTVASGTTAPGTSPREAAVARFEKAVPVLAAWWPRLDAGQRSNTADAIIEMLFRVSGDLALTERIVAAVATGAEPLVDPAVPLTADRIYPAIWSVGMMARLTRERELPAGVGLRIQRTVGTALGGARLPAQSSFNTAAALALRAMPLRILKPLPGKPAAPAETTAALERWLAAIAALFGEGPAESQAAENLIVESLERILVAGPEPDQDKATFDAISLLASKLRWRAADSSRRRLLAWFDDRGISHADLAAVTSAMVAKSSAEGLDLTMVLSAGASPEQRTALRDAFALNWSITAANAGSSSAEGWAHIARAELAYDDGTNPIDALRGVIAFARLNQAAWQRHAGDSQGLAETLAKHVQPARRSGVPSPAFLTLIDPTHTADGQWALRFLSPDKSGISKVDRLRELASRTDIGPIDADVLAEVALLGSGEARAAALRLLPQFSLSVNIPLSMLKFLHRAPRSGPLAAAVMGVSNRPTGPWNGERWPVLARRALVERALELLSADGDTAQIDSTSVALAAVYTSALGRPQPTGGYDADDAGLALRDAAAALFASLHDAAIRASPNDQAPRSIEEIDRRHQARLSVARGLVQQFAADQAGCVELLAFITSAERPGSAADCRTVVDTFAAQERDAGHVLFQVRAGEAAMVKLWLLRSGEGPL